jgi:hypothetical protein
MPLKNLLFSRSLFALHVHTWIPRVRQLLVFIIAVLIVTMLHIQWFFDAYCCYPSHVKWQTVDDKDKGICGTQAANDHGLTYSCDTHPIAWYGVLATVLILFVIDIMLFAITLHAIGKNTTINVKTGLRHDLREINLSKELKKQCSA